MNLQGNQYIGFSPSGAGKQAFQAINPVNGEKLIPFFKEATDEEIALAGEKASNAFQQYRLTSGAEKAHFLDEKWNRSIALGWKVLLALAHWEKKPEIFAVQNLPEKQR